MAQSNQSIRLYSKATVLGYRRSHVRQYPNVSLLRIEGLKDKSEVDFYLGKRVAYIYRAKRRDVSGSNVRVVWGRICTPHGNNGVVRARFAKNLPPKAVGARCRVMLYPSRV